MWQKQNVETAEIETISEQRIHYDLKDYYKVIDYAIESMRETPGSWICRTDFAFYRWTEDN